MPSEEIRKCGFRKLGGVYLRTDPGTTFTCGRLPLELTPCPLCDHKPNFVRSLQRIVPRNILHAAGICESDPVHCLRCPLGTAMETETAGLLWVGSQYTPEDFMEESKRLGVSKRIPWPVPKWLQIGSTWVFLAHAHTFHPPCPDCSDLKLRAPDDPPCETCDGEGQLYQAGVFTAFIPKRIERVVPLTFPEEEAEKLRKQGITPVFLDTSQPEHAGREE